MTRTLYSMLFYLLMPALWLRVLFRSISERRYRADPWQRLGFSPCLSSDKPVLWVHAVSAGETNAVAPLVELLLGDGFHVVLTNMTPTGRDRAEALFGERVTNCYAPYDLPGSTHRFVSRVRPAGLVIVDTELWPNMVHAAKHFGAPVMQVNGRLSERSAKGYARFGTIVEAMLNEMSLVAVQTPAQGERFVNLGLPEDRVAVTGSIKFDIPLPEDFAEKVGTMKALFDDGLRIIAASTHGNEEAQILGAFSRIRRAHPDAQLVLAPRHPRRAAEVADLIAENGFTVARRSQGDRAGTDSVYLLDTMGELCYFYGVSDIAFVGGSLVDVGGHNFMEAVIAEVPVIMGSHLEDIEDIASQFVESDAMKVVATVEELESVLGGLVTSEQSRRELVLRANEVYDRNRGALYRTRKLITNVMKQAEREAQGGTTIA